MFRTTWEKTTNPYVCNVHSGTFVRGIPDFHSGQLRLIAQSPIVSLHRKILLPRPSTSAYDRPITVHIYFAPPAPQLCNTTDLILDFPGGGFVAMSPEHHNERLRAWTLRTGKPVLAVDYGKSPECNHPPSLHLARRSTTSQTLIRLPWTSVLISTSFSRKHLVDVLACRVRN